MSAKEKILAYLAKDGDYNTLTVNKMQSMFGVRNPSAVVNELRNEGNAIYRNTRTLSNGEKISFYRLGTPTKRMVAAGIQSLRQAGFSSFA